ncbi:hypothetical protein PROFUN_01712 [Planoprotostelium fungivorum]|uniref:GP-PDE domain-containing protein n=1 Tax=Planoprotostelium fungivorum TaxID=1890364 RepID=A0A2P6MWH2_9EUKA|nr:hypothetical protein PROFUN_01712 [Planoprotostelium fungivorum]
MLESALYLAIPVIFVSFCVVYHIALHHPTLTHKKKQPFGFSIAHSSHRGGAGENPENTLLAFRHSVEKAKTDLIELDVLLTRDKRVVVVHDDEFSHISDRLGSVSTTLYEDLPLVFDKEPIPLLSEVFEMFPNTAINLDFKAPDPELLDHVYDLIVRYNMRDKIIWGSGFNNEEFNKLIVRKDSTIKRFFSQPRALRIYLLHVLCLLPFVHIEEDAFEAPYIHSTFVREEIFPGIPPFFLPLAVWCMKRLFMSKSLFSHLRKRGLVVLLWTPNEWSEFEEAKQTGVDGVAPMHRTWGPKPEEFQKSQKSKALSLARTQRPRASIAHQMAANGSSPLLVSIGSNFWNVRCDYKVKAVFNVGTHMSVARLSTGKFLIIDAAPALNNPTLVKELNELTSNGENIEAIIHTHPFHTGSIVTLSNLYPNAAVYGCPRHLKMFPDLKWTGDLSEPTNLARWQPEVDLRIPTGTEFFAPAEDNHFSSIWAYHRESKTIHVDDTLSYAQTVKFPDCLSIPCCPEEAFNLARRPPKSSRLSLQTVMQDWDFENIAAAHMGVLIGNGKRELGALLERTQREFDKLTKKYSKK